MDQIISIKIQRVMNDGHNRGKRKTTTFESRFNSINDASEFLTTIRRLPDQLKERSQYVITTEVDQDKRGVRGVDEYLDTLETAVKTAMAVPVKVKVPGQAESQVVISSNDAADVIVDPKLIPSLLERGIINRCTVCDRGHYHLSRGASYAELLKACSAVQTIAVDVTKETPAKVKISSEDSADLSVDAKIVSALLRDQLIHACTLCTQVYLVRACNSLMMQSGHTVPATPKAAEPLLPTKPKLVTIVGNAGESEIKVGPETLASLLKGEFVYLCFMCSGPNDPVYHCSKGTTLLTVRKIAAIYRDARRAGEKIGSIPAFGISK